MGEDSKGTRRPRRLSGRLIYLATIMAMIGIAGGTVMATLLTPIPTNQTANFYEGGNSGVPNYPAPMLAPGSNVVGTCTTSSTTVATSTTPATTNIVLASSGSTGTCVTNDFAEVFTFSFTISTPFVSSQTNTISITTEYGTGTTVYTNSAQVVLTTPSSGGPFVATLDIYVDYGSVNPPTGGIAVLDLVVT
jgi:hypothetical protein